MLLVFQALEELVVFLACQVAFLVAYLVAYPVAYPVAYLVAYLVAFQACLAFLVSSSYDALVLLVQDPSS
jgi:hypothetical protein